MQEKPLAEQGAESLPGLSPKRLHTLSKETEQAWRWLWRLEGNTTLYNGYARELLRLSLPSAFGTVLKEFKKQRCGLRNQQHYRTGGGNDSCSF